MSGTTPLIDTLLATTLAQRVDLVPLKPQVEIPEPKAVLNVGGIANDHRLASRAAMERQLGTESAAQAGAAAARHSSASASVLSAAARAISQALAIPLGAATGVRGSAPIWPLPMAPAPHLLAAALARAVDVSGLFYESHLVQYGAGRRTLAQLAQEPQARLGSLAKIHPELAGDLMRAQGGLLAALLEGIPEMPPVTAESASSAVPRPAEGSAEPQAAGGSEAHAAGRLKPGEPPASADGSERSAVDTAVGSSTAGLSGRPNAASIAATYGRASLPGSGNAPANLPGSSDGSGSMGAGGDSSDTARAGSHVPPVIHPDAVGLVREQLDLLASAAFRWNGEAWPGARLDWEIAEQRDEGHDSADGNPVQRTWDTRLTLALPRLGDIEVRLSLAGADLRARMIARDDSARALLQKDGDKLRQRFADAGMQLAAFDIAVASA